MCNNDSKDCKCIAEILRTINILQENARCEDECLETCDRGFLGCSTKQVFCNTRPVMLFTCCGNGQPWKMPVTKDSGMCDEPCVVCSDVFRIEKLDGCCATFRVLAKCDSHSQDDYNEEHFVATNSFFTMNLSCVCVIRCLHDTFIDCI